MSEINEKEIKDSYTSIYTSQFLYSIAAARSSFRLSKKYRGKRKILIWYLAIFTFTDLWKGKIPNWLILAGMLHGLLLTKDYLQMIIQTVCVFFIFYPIFKIGMLGAGDIKIFLLLGIFLARKDFISVITVTFFVALLFSAVKVAVCRTGIRETKIHLALSVLIAVLIVRGGIL